MKKPLIISALCVALAAALFVWGFQSHDAPAATGVETYALVIGTDTGSFVMQLRKGMAQAAAESGARLAVYTPKELTDIDALSGAVVWLEEPGAVLERLAGVPTVVVGQRYPDAVCVRSDDASAGGQLMRYALGERTTGSVVLLRDDADERAKERGDAALAAAEGAPVTELAYQPTLALPADCQVAVATSLRGTRALTSLKKAGRYAGLVLGVDTGDERVSDLEGDWVAAMALDSPYAMGYVALGKAQELAAGGAPADGTTRVLLATRANMYLAQNVKLVFPLLQ